MNFGPIDYASATPPRLYECHSTKCPNQHGVRLWREYQTMADYTALYCLVCAQKNQKKSGYHPTEDGKSLYDGIAKHWYRTASTEPGWWSGYDPAKGVPAGAIETKQDEQRCDQIGWLVPAVPVAEGDTYWGYSSVPDAGCQWWYRLPYALPK